MGQTLPTQRCSVSIPSRVLCFPYFSDESELLLNSNRACLSLRQFRGAVGCIANVLSPQTPAQSAINRMFTSATRTLLQYLLGKLCNQMLASGEERFQSICNDQAKVNSSDSDIIGHTNNNNKVEELRDINSVRQNRSPAVASSSSSGSKETIPTGGFGTLEEALIQVKIGKAIANAAVAQLHAKLVAVENRYGRLILETIPLEDRRLEVVPALSLCEEILQLFRDPGHIFMKQPLISAPFVVTFAAIYAAVAELSLGLIPSYSDPLIRQILILKQTVNHYKVVCVEVRVRSLVVKSAVLGCGGQCGESSRGGSMMNEAFVGMNNIERYLYVDDKFSGCYPAKCSMGVNSGKGEIDNHNRVQTFTTEEEALEMYKKALENQYDSFFEEVLNVISSFSGFEDVSDSPTSQFYHKD